MLLVIGSIVMVTGLVLFWLGSKPKAHAQSFNSNPRFVDDLARDMFAGIVEGQDDGFLTRWRRDSMEATEHERFLRRVQMYKERAGALKEAIAPHLSQELFNAQIETALLQQLATNESYRADEREQIARGLAALLNVSGKQVEARDKKLELEIKQAESAIKDLDRAAPVADANAADMKAQAEFRKRAWDSRANDGQMGQENKENRG